MKKTYGITVQMTGTQYIEVYCEEGDEEDLAYDEVDPSKVDDWDIEIIESEQVEP